MKERKTNTREREAGKPVLDAPISLTKTTNMLLQKVFNVFNAQYREKKSQLLSRAKKVPVLVTMVTISGDV